MSRISGIKWGIIGSLPNPPRGLPSSSPVGKSPIDTWHHYVYPDIPYPEHTVDLQFNFPGYIPSRTYCRPTIQLSQLYPIQNILSADNSTSSDISYPEHTVNRPGSMPVRNWESDSNSILDQVSQIIARLQFKTCLIGQKSSQAA